MADPLASMPANFKPIQHYLKTATEHDKRDPVVAYYCRLYAMQKGMEIDKKSPESRNFLRTLMGHLEEMKTQLKDSEAIQSELVGQAHVENYAVKLFFYADTEDRKSNFGKNVVKAFYTSSMLFDVLTTFGELPDELEKSRKYAKWKAAYIHNCLKIGATPQPGPQAEAADELGISADHQFQLPPSSANHIPDQNPMTNSTTSGPSNLPADYSLSNNQQPPQPYFMNQPINKVLPSDQPTLPPNNHASPFGFGQSSAAASYPPNIQQPQFPGYNFPNNQPSPHYPQPSPSSGPPTQPQPTQRHTPQTTTANTGAAVSLKHDDFSKAMKFCKYANSALQYEDAPTAIQNLTKALNILKTGKE